MPKDLIVFPIPFHAFVEGTLKQNTNERHKVEFKYDYGIAVVPAGRVGPIV
jgi:hypothetical protein